MMCLVSAHPVSGRLVPFVLIPLAAALLLAGLGLLLRAARRSIAAEKAAREDAMERENEPAPLETHEARVTDKYQDIGPHPLYPASVPRVRHMIVFSYDGQEKAFPVPEDRFSEITLYAVGTLILQDGMFLDFDTLCDGIVQPDHSKEDQPL